MEYDDLILGKKTLELITEFDALELFSFLFSSVDRIFIGETIMLFCL